MIRPSQLPHDGMMSKPAQDFMASVSPRQMLGLDGPLGTMATAPLGRPMPGPLPRYPHSEALQYNGSYFSYRLCGQEGGGGGEHPSAWSPSLAYLGSGGGGGSNSSRSPTAPTAVTEGSIMSPIVYRQDKVSLPAGSAGSPLTVAQELAVKRRHAVAGYYPDRSQAQCSSSNSSSSSPSVVTPSPMRRQPLAGANLSPQTEGPMGLAVPKPLYSHNACCSDLRCTAGYSAVEQSLHRTPASLYEDEWLVGYGGAVPLAPSRKDLDMLLEQRGLHAEPRAERAAGKEEASEEFCDLDTFLNQRGSVYSDVSHSSYACSPTSSAPFIGAPPDQCQRFQFPPKDYPGLPSSHPHMYDPAALSAQYGVPRKVYPEYSHAPSFVQVPQRPRVYYAPQDHVEACAGGVRRKYSDGTPSPSPERRDGLSSPAQCSLPQHVPPPVFAAGPPAHCHMRLSRHPFPPRNFDHLAYRPYQLHVNGSHPRAAPVRPPSYPLPTRPLPSRPPEKPLDYSVHRGQPGSSPCQFPVPSSLSGVVPPKPRTLEHSSPKLHHAGSVKRPQSYYVGATHFPVDVSGKYSASDKHPSDISDPKVRYGNLLAKSNCERPLNTRDNVSSGDADVYEVEVTTKKRKKIDVVQEAAALPKSAPSPPMPVINQVFSLAPYKLYLEAAGVLPAVKRCNSAENAPQPPGTPKQDPEISEGNRKYERRDSRSLSVNCFEEPTETVPVKTEKINHPKEDAAENNLCDREIIKSESCTDATEGECRSPLKTNQQTERRSPILAGDAVPKCKVEVTSGRNTDTNLSFNKGTKDVAPVVRPAVKSSTPPVTLALKSLPSPQTTPIRVDLQNIPPQCLKLSTYNIVLPEVLRTSVRPVPRPLPLPLPLPPPLLKSASLPPMTPAAVAPQLTPADPAGDPSVLRQARHQFMELHQSLCKLVYTLATETPPQELRDWLFKMELGNKTTYPPDKHQRVASLVGARAREMWARTGERSLALQKVLGKLKNYEVRGECPFPHVMRAGGTFVPMLVVKEGLFPQVHGTFIDQVLQEHRVELRPTTLSEEKHLTQLQKRACSSKLRRLLSLRHLPDIYVDVLNLFYYTSVCKVLDVASDVSIKIEPEDLFEGKDTSGNSPASCCTEESPSDSKSTQGPESVCFTVKQEPEESDISAPSGSREKEQETVEELENMEEPMRWTIVNSLAGGEEEAAWEVCTTDSKEGLNIKVEMLPEEEEEQEEVKEEEQGQEEELGSSWGGPVSSDETCSGDSDPETAELDSVYTRSCCSSSSSSANNSSASAKAQGAVRSHSGVILKLRKVLGSGGAHGGEARYQAVSDLTDPADPGDPATEGKGEPQRRRDGDERRKRDRGKWKRDRGEHQKHNGRHKDHQRERDERGHREEERRRRRERKQRRRRRHKEQSRSRRRERRLERRRRTRALSPLTDAPPSRERSALPKIRYCPFLSTCHRSDRRRRWVLRSAVQSAQQALQSHASLPALVGKRIRHLYEEKDRSEVWYRGAVLRVHEPHTNPLQTVFEVKYDSEPEWRYYLELLVDYQKGWLKVDDF